MPRSWIPSCSAVAVFVSLFLLHTGVAIGQSVTAEAQRLQQAGDLDGAARVLRAHLEQHPQDGDAARLLAQTLYWLKDVSAARALYESALQRNPQDDQLRLDYARMLGETGERGAAQRLLAPLAGGRPRAETYALLGTFAYWNGDFTAAARLFEQTLQLDPTHAEARRQLREIQLASTPWLRLSPTVWYDDQPLDRRAAAIEGGWFASPLTPIRLRIQAAEHDGGGVSRRMWIAEADIRHYLPALRLETELAGGVVRGRVGREQASEWIGRGALGVRVPGHVTIRGRVERALYLSTTSSLSARILTDTTSGELHWNSPRGWTGQAAVSQQRFPDRNAINVRYAWLLAPLLRSQRFDLQGGYAVAFEHADESRFVLVESMQAYEPSDPRFDTTGRYAPYYTPAHVLKHSIVSSVTARMSARATARLGGSVAVRATEDVPQWQVLNGVLVRTFAPRNFQPWDVRSSLDVTAADDVTIGITAETGRGAFYQWGTAGVHLTYRFTGAARRTAVVR